jgi:pyruvate,water dikinase
MGLTFVPFGQGLRQLVDFLAAEFGAEAQTLAGLTSGHANATLDADQALWGLADIGRNSPPLRKFFADGRAPPTLDALRRVDGGEAFTNAFQRYLESYGWRTEGWDTSSPTWREYPSIPLALISRMIQDDAPSPREIMRKTARRRRSLARTLEQRLAPSKRSEFRSVLERASSWVRVKEGRAYWQLRASGALRSVLLRKGAALARAGKVHDPEDIFYLLPAEIEDSAGLPEARPSGRRAEDFFTIVEARRQQRERC